MKPKNPVPGKGETDLSQSEAWAIILGICTVCVLTAVVGPAQMIDVLRSKAPKEGNPSEADPGSSLPSES